MSSRKRKRCSKEEDVKRVFCPDADDHRGLQQNVGRETSLLSSSRSWAKCGDSFLGTPVIKNLQPSRRKLSVVRRLTQSPALVQSSAPRCNEDPVHIAWSSTDTEQSDDENQQEKRSKAVSQQQQHRWPQRRGKATAPIQSYSRALSMLTADKDNLPVIDTDSDLDESEEGAEKESEQQISDCESKSADDPKDFPVESTTDKELEITGYVSDGEDIGSTLTSSKLDSEIFPLQNGEGSKRSVSDWLKSAQAMLQTPQKPTDRQSKTPDDSAKKKRKFKSGGLAERLNRLQCRQRSAISFWRHKSISDTPAATSTTDRPGVLVLEVLDVHEECSMQLARCEHWRPPGDGDRRNKSVPGEGRRMLVLFNKETAAQLSPAPGDVIHIYPPWQSLSIEGFSSSVILNTHFSQKAYSASKPASNSLPRAWVPAKRHAPYHLAQTFGLSNECRTKCDGGAKQVAASDALCSAGGSGVLVRRCASLLEAIEGLGQAGSVEQDVDVVVQRVYSIPLADASPTSLLKHRVPLRSSLAPPAEKGKTRLCVLVQDGCGIFSVVQLQPLTCGDELHRFCQMWQGRTCVLKGVKVVQRVTRERHSRLFSLIDSLWPPTLPPKEHGNSLSVPKESGAPGQAPSFCYLLSGQQSSLEPTEGPIMSPLYLPPRNRSLRDVLQSEEKTCRCSFVATVLYKRMQLQSPDIGQGEVRLVLTDPSLQEELPERLCGQTVALCVNTSCVLTSSVLEALSSPAACQMSFRDAIQENGVLLCAEQSVIEVRSAEGGVDPLAGPLPEPQVKTLRLDSLSLETTPNSLCTLTGVIVGVDENTAYSWPACNLCGSDHLELSEETPLNFLCVSCKSVLDKPDTKVQLEVFLSSSALSNCTLKVKLQQKTILTLLNAGGGLEGDELQGYDVESVLGKEVGPIPVYVRVVARKPAFWMGLEEICLGGC
ncbi:DNA repair-scaffolding protein isoform X2 [Kryptolebias marmoratus]|uniref:Scaffold protein involved in DNA repair n=1 Tax=Kryptolebias marmoratus TaxID=37003 RepID=A0A3Q3EZN1_KRYMA|nr:DNA repair-scaffolding protein isoform X2 [Kryptolebias marmoratus]